MRTGRYSLSQLMNSNDVERIIVPEIQRDYVWQIQNVNCLLASVKFNFDRKSNTNLSICHNSTPIDGVTYDYLLKEFERIKFNTRIGFIYAYYDAVDSRTLYLIDGQQRITTLFLLLLAIYSILPNGEKQFFEKYFKNENPKLDYRVRDNAHNFLIDFIKFVFSTKGKSVNFKELSPQYYDIYSTDPTISSILRNFTTIHNWVLSYSESIGELCHYVEDFVEFNYFDTGISEQGEKLYLYMNSRGEGLSAQENIRPRIISRCLSGQKLQAGECWEQWQNFFWHNRNKNINADEGFFGFIKVATILHQQVNSETCLLKMDSGNSNNRTDSPSRIDHRKEYISNSLAQYHKQWIYQYINENKDFTFEWLRDVFIAYKRIFELNFNSKYKFIRETAFASKGSMDTINYAPLCASVLLCKEVPTISDEYLHRFGMYILGHSDKSDNSKVPETATIRAMNMADYMAKIPSQDIRYLKGNIPEINKYYYRSSDKFFNCVGCTNNDAMEWEALFWEIIADKQFNVFLDADYNSIIELSIKDNVPNISLGKLYREKLRTLFTKHDDIKYVSSIMGYGDISQECGTGWLGHYMDKYTLPLTKEFWQKVLSYKEHLDIVKAFFDCKKPNALNNYIKALTSDAVINYIQNGRYLWEDGNVYPNIIVLQKNNASEHLAKSLPIMLLKESLKHSWLWNDDHRYCVIDFCVENRCFAPKQGGTGKYCIDIIYNWDKTFVRWDCWLKQRNHQRIPQMDNKYPYNEEEAGYLLKTFNEIPNDMLFTPGYNNEGSMDVIGEICKYIDTEQQELPKLLCED